MDAAERIQAASKFLLQSPPGEINDVLNDIRTIIADDDALQAGILPAVEAYNMAQLITVDVPGADHQVIISESSRIASSSEQGNGHRFVDPRSKTSFQFDHLRLDASDSQPFEINAKAETMRSALESATLVYIKDHFYDGVATVLASPLVEEDAAESIDYIIQFVGNKYNPANYWSGRWRSSYTLQPKEEVLKGSVDINVHYYEQGNVQLATRLSPTITIPPNLAASLSQPGSAAKVLALIEAEETSYQQKLAETYHAMGDKTFKSLRRALPLTRQKVDWDKVMGYKLGAELNASKGVFGTTGASNSEQ